MDEARERGIIDSNVCADVHPEFVQRCMSEILVIDVNRRTLELFAAPSKQILSRDLARPSATIRSSRFAKTDHCGMAVQQRVVNN
jgi:hypothetical protein